MPTNAHADASKTANCPLIP